ncbi:MAG: SDR family NAD(P)-dependent oxidoreductase [Dehalococcoidia bacterium]|nr:SDR family NAD(P)-dependent oxidoreductase [Dehalococcoidia bacterium]
MVRNLDGKVAVITGSGRGIGREVALFFAQEGARVVVNDPGVNSDGSGHDGGPADGVVAEIQAAGGEAAANYDTVATVDGGERIIQTALDSFGRLDILVNVAGILRDRMIFNMSEQDWDEVIAVHLKGHFTCTKPASVLMRQQRYGRIINFTSISGLWGNAGQANYGAAKSGIAGFTRVVARDLGRYGVTVNCISPAAQTRMIDTIPSDMKLPGPEFVPPIVAYLASDDAWNINGAVFHVAGGELHLFHHPVPQRSIFKPDRWTLDELEELVPTRLMEGIANPAPPRDDIDVPGRGRVTTEEVKA